MNYQKALNELNSKVRNRDTKKIANNTYLIRDNDQIHVQLHGTYVITFHSDGAVETHTGGWETVTTKDRINSYIDNFSIFSLKGNWCIRDLRTNIDYEYQSGELETSTGEILLTPVIVSVLSEISGQSLTSLEQAAGYISRLNLEELPKIWRRGTKWIKGSLRAFIARHCIQEFLPLIVTINNDYDEAWREVASSRLKGVAT